MIKIKLFNTLNEKEFFYSKDNIWDNELFSNFVLSTHLNPELEGGSKDLNYIKKSVDFISNIAPQHTYKNVLDFGCGPGIYANLLSRKGYNVIGIDISKKSIDYAKSNIDPNFNVQFINKDIFDFVPNNLQDTVLIIYQLYGTFSYEDRIRLLKKINKLMRINGKLIIDALSLRAYDKFSEKQEWSFSKKNNMVTKENFLALMCSQKFDNNITLQKTTYVFSNDYILDFSDWNKYFSLKELKEELYDCGFEIVSKHEDVSGEPFNKEKDCFAVVAKKKENCDE
ncbi:class I SAM-dependent methyltransferase [Staphylococcus felis]|uniref:class I SAM-dependent methyltransferase n=1 Tax=Staphylococcus felis TaxID=46127 RepID=UPI00247FB5A2|nr:methyltransferase domain-containing protein [Staphylococcus felis]